MALRLSDGLKNAMIGTDDFKGLMDLGYLDIYSGAQPANANAVETGTKLVSLYGTGGTGGIGFGTAASGILPLNNIGAAGTVLVDGIAGWARLYDSNKTTGTNGTARRMDMSVGLSGANLVVTHTSLTADTIFTQKTLNLTQPAE